MPLASWRTCLDKHVEQRYHGYQRRYKNNVYAVQFGEVKHQKKATRTISQKRKRTATLGDIPHIRCSTNTAVARIRLVRRATRPTCEGRKKQVCNQCVRQLQFLTFARQFPSFATSYQTVSHLLMRQRLDFRFRKSSPQQ